MTVKVFCTGGIGNCLYHIAAGRYLRNKGYTVEFIDRCAHAGTSDFINKLEPLVKTDDRYCIPNQHRYTIAELENIAKNYNVVSRWCFISSIHDLIDIHVETEPVIGIHIRRGDFVPMRSSSPWFHDLCITSYYSNVNKICDSLSLPIKIFTDDPSTIPDNILKLFNCEVVSSTPESDFYELAKCKYKFISNSTFSIWAAYVNKEATVFYPHGLLDQLMLNKWIPIKL